MIITDRQKEILNTIVQEYIGSAEPVSSKLLENKYDFGICPASIRIEMQKLTDGGFLQQPHTSAGRIPTDKSYRLLVSDLLEEDFEKTKNRRMIKEFQEIEEEMNDSFKFFQFLTKKVAEMTNSLTLSYLSDKDIFLKEGWTEIIKEPEFEDNDYLLRFFETAENLEENLKRLKPDSGIKVYIGNENPLTKSDDFSLITSRYEFPEKGEGLLAVFGPKRMPYQRNIELFNSLITLLEEDF